MLITETILDNEPTLLIKDFEKQPDFYTTKITVSEVQVALMFSRILKHWSRGIICEKQGVSIYQMSAEELILHKEYSAGLRNNTETTFRSKMPSYSQREIDLCAAKQNYKLCDNAYRRDKEQYDLYGAMIKTIDEILADKETTAEAEMKLLEEQVGYINKHIQLAKSVAISAAHRKEYKNKIDILKGR